MKIKTLFVLFLLFEIFAFSMVSAATSNLQTALQQLCKFLYQVIGNLAIVMVALSSISYAAGQMLGAEMRARAILWSHSLLAGAVIGLLLVLIIPQVLAAMLGMTYDPNNCTFH